jgi:hypothetical protein
VPSRIRTTWSTPSRVPTVTSRSPAISTNAGPGDTAATPPRITATIDAPVRVRACVSPSPASGERRSGRHRQRLDDQPGRLTLDLGKHTHHARRAQDLSERVSFLLAQRNTVERPITLHVIDDEIAPAVAMGDDTNPTATSKINLLAHPNTRKDTTDDHRSHQRLLIANERTSRTARST